jgi:poly-beta-1,6-N-acetyl-D-glucosamine synthase
MLTYSVVTPVRDEESNLARLLAAVEAQSVRPLQWLIVDNGSTDATPSIARAAAARCEWISLLEIPGEATSIRGRPIVRAIHAGIRELQEVPDVFVSVDADVSFKRDYFERLLRRFEADPRLGLASGSGHELDGAQWRQRHLTGSTVWGATRAYRWDCLQQVLPFEERLGWDGVDEFKANALGWRTETFRDLPFYHHRPEGERDGARFRTRFEQGRAAHFTGYRPLYLLLRALFHVRREGAAVALLAGYASAALQRQPRLADAGARRYVRRQQRLSALPARLREVRGKTR